eukprot:SAG11_NODE_1824_length_4204_cov_8.667235_2_plen_96_part_00
MRQILIATPPRLADQEPYGVFRKFVLSYVRKVVFIRFVSIKTFVFIPLALANERLHRLQQRCPSRVVLSKQGQAFAACSLLRTHGCLSPRKASPP